MILIFCFSVNCGKIYSEKSSIIFLSDSTIVTLSTVFFSEVINAKYPSPSPRVSTLPNAFSIGVCIERISFGLIAIHSLWFCFTQGNLKFSLKKPICGYSLNVEVVIKSSKIKASQGKYSEKVNSQSLNFF